MDFEALPGGDLIRRGLADCAAGRDSAEALLVQIAGSRLRRLGLDVPANRGESTEPAEHRLYRHLARSDPRRAHSRYNALVRRLSSFERAARRSRRIP